MTKSISPYLVDFQNIASSSEWNYISFLQHVNLTNREKNLNETCADILQTVLDPRSVASQDALSFPAKMQSCVTILSTFQHSSRPLCYTTELIRQLVERIINPENSEEVKSRAEYALLALEKIDPSLSSLNYEISRFLHCGTEKAPSRLREFAKNPPKPLIFHSPLKQQNRPTGAPNYAALLPKREKKMHTPPHNSHWKISEILVGGNAGCYLENLREIAELEGIPKVSSFPVSEIKWLRDAFLFLNNRLILAPKPFNTTHPGDFFAHFLGKGSRFSELIKRLTFDPEVAVMGAVSDQKTTETLLGSTIEGVREVPYYFEGGNLIPAINQYGKKVYLCGAHNILFSILNASNIFSTDEKKRRLLKEMESLEGTPLFSKAYISFIHMRLESAGLLSSELPINSKEKAAKLFLASAEYIKKLMTVHLAASVIILGGIFEAPVEFHLDIFLLPAPDGVIFMQDNLLCQKALKEIAKHYKLTTAERKRLSEYLACAEEKEKKEGGKLRRIRDSLESAGFEVIPMPGIFYEPSGKPAMHFLNAIMGQGKEGKFCISNGSSHSLDRYLREAFTALLQESGINHVYFTGRKMDIEAGDSLSPLKYSAAEKGLCEMGGIHCRTQEIRELDEGLLFREEAIKSQKESNFSSYIGDSFQEFLQEMINFLGS